MQGSEWSRNYRGLRAFCAVFLSVILVVCAAFYAFAPSEDWFSTTLAEEEQPLPAPLVEPVPPPPAPAEPEAPGNRLDIRNILQKPELPNGCEATSAAIVLGYLGYPADKLELADDYLPKQSFYTGKYGLVNGDPEEVYPGNPRPGGSGYYCYPAPVTRMLNTYLEEWGGRYAAVDATGADEQALLGYLDSFTPIIVWNTLNNDEPVKSARMKWILPESYDLFVPYVNLHVSVLSGYDEENFYFCDPLGETDSLPREAFMEIYEEMGSRAVVVLRADTLTAQQRAQVEVARADADEESVTSSSSSEPDEESAASSLSSKSDEDAAASNSSSKPDEQSAASSSSNKPDDEAAASSSFNKPDEDAAASSSSSKPDEQPAASDASRRESRSG